MSIIEKLESLSVPRSKESKEREEKRRLFRGLPSYIKEQIWKEKIRAAMNK